MLSKLDGRAWRWLSPAAADGFEPVFSRSWGPDAPSRPGRAAGSCPRWESSKANLIWTRVCSHQYHQLVQAEHSVYPVKYRDTWYLCPLGNPDIAQKLIPGAFRSDRARSAKRGEVTQPHAGGDASSAAVKPTRCVDEPSVGGASSLWGLTVRRPRGRRSRERAANQFQIGEDGKSARGESRLHGHLGAGESRWHATSPAHPVAVTVHERVDAKACL